MPCKYSRIELKKICEIKYFYCSRQLLRLKLRLTFLIKSKGSWARIYDPVFQWKTGSHPAELRMRMFIFRWRHISIFIIQHTDGKGGRYELAWVSETWQTKLIYGLAGHYLAIFWLKEDVFVVLFVVILNLCEDVLTFRLGVSMRSMLFTGVVS